MPSLKRKRRRGRPPKRKIKKRQPPRKPKPSRYSEAYRTAARERMREKRDETRVMPYFPRYTARKVYIPPLAELERILENIPKPFKERLRKKLEEEEE